MIRNVDKYIEFTIAQEEYFKAGKIGKSNKMSDKAREIYKDWQEGPNIDLKELAPLLNHEYECVRVSAGYLLIGIIPEAENTLEDIVARKIPEVSFEAYMILKLWREGRLER